MLRGKFRLNGWQRLWIVISLLLLVVTLLYALREVGQNYRVDYLIVEAFEAPECDYIRKLPAGFKLDKPPTFDSPCSHLYYYKLFHPSPAKDAQDYKNGMSEQYWKMLGPELLAMMALWAVGMGLLYGAGATVAWVIRGFKGEK